MNELFDYFDEAAKSSIKTVIGQYISHNIKWKKANGDLLTIDEVNQLPRMKLAEEFVKHRTYNGKYSFDARYTVLKPYEEYELHNDIALFIDFKIPKCYFLYLYEKKIGNCIDRSESAKFYEGIDSIEGLEFFYPENYEVELHWLNERESFKKGYRGD